MPKLKFYASIINHNGKPALLIRKIMTNKEDVKEIVSEIVRKGKYEFEGVLVFRNVVVAIRALKDANLI